jgi:hypothetical protein
MTMKRKQEEEEEEEKKKDRKVRVISFRLSERDYERHLLMAKLCYENGLTKGPDIVSLRIVPNLPITLVTRIFIAHRVHSQ